MARWVTINDLSQLHDEWAMYTAKLIVQYTTLVGGKGKG